MGPPVETPPVGGTWVLVKVQVTVSSGCTFTVAVEPDVVEAPAPWPASLQPIPVSVKPAAATSLTA